MLFTESMLDLVIERMKHEEDVFVFDMCFLFPRVVRKILIAIS